uniref:Serine/threonine-protein kinase 1 n=1 Tax=Schistocephalus solidus TaxID=70667 RepID=A0A0X3Q162_SCHSO
MSLASYSIVEAIAHGDTTTVVRAYRKSDSKKCVLKYYDVQKNKSDMFVLSKSGQPMPIEAYILLKTKEVQGCVRMLEFFEDEQMQKFVIVLEDLHSQGFTNLASELLSDEEYIDESAVSWIMRETIHTLRELHDLNIVHCDIKPDNIFIKKDERKVKLIDFNFSMELIPAELPQRNIGCTPEYAPPEVLLLKRPWTTASEVWSLGSTAFVLLYKYFPFADPYTSHRRTPNYPENDCLSYKARDFLMLCFHRKPECRPNFSRLSNHPFIVDTTRRPHGRLLSSSKASLVPFPAIVKAS